MVISCRKLQILCLCVTKAAATAAALPIGIIPVSVHAVARLNSTTLGARTKYVLLVADCYLSQSGTRRSWILWSTKVKFGRSSLWRYWWRAWGHAFPGSCSVATERVSAWWALHGECSDAPLQILRNSTWIRCVTVVPSLLPDINRTCSRTPDQFAELILSVHLHTDRKYSVIARKPFSCNSVASDLQGLACINFERRYFFSFFYTNGDVVGVPAQETYVNPPSSFVHARTLRLS